MHRHLRPLALAAGFIAVTTVLGSCATDIPAAPLAKIDATPANLIGPMLVITEIMPDPSKVSDNVGEWFEIYNAGGVAVDLNGYKLLSGVTNPPESHTIASSVMVPSGGYVVLGNNANTATNGGVTLNYAYPATFIFNNSNTDWVALKRADNTLVDSVAYSPRSGGAVVAPTYTPTSGASRVLGPADAGGTDNTIIGGNVAWANTPTGTTYGAGDRGTPGSGPYIRFTPPPVVVHHVHVTPETATILQGAPPQDFDAVAHDAAHAELDVTITWSSTDETIATVDGDGLATGRAPGIANIRATANGTVGFGVLTVEEAPIPGLPEVRFSEIHYDNFDVDMGEAIEIEGPAGTNLTGWSVVLYNGNGGRAYDTRALTQTIPTMCSGGGRGVIVIAYEQDGIQNGDADGLALVDASGNVVEFLSYEGTLVAADGPAAGTTSTNMGVVQSGAALFQTLQRRPTGYWEGPKPSTLGGCYGSTPVTPHNQIRFSGRSPFDPATPVGFEDQIFATLVAPNGSVVSTTITWSPETPALASIDGDGVFHGLTAGMAKFRATASDAAATTNTFSLPIHVATAGSAVYANHVEFGTPADADASDDYIVSRAEYTSSFNKTRGIPNWVSFNIEATHYGPQDRCDCFTYDPLLPADFTRYTTADYTGAGAFHGYGIDRGHLARSFDRTSGSLDNADTYLFSNIIPQAADNNQGPWANMENAIGNLARFDNKELFVIAGAAGNKGTVKNEGKITIPAHTWKIVVVLPRDRGLADVDSYDDLEVIAVIMPNDPGIRSTPNDPNDWKAYRTTVDAVEALSGYDLLDLLPDKVEAVAEAGMQDEMALVDKLVEDGKINKGNGNALTSKLEAAAASIQRGNTTAAKNELEAFLNQLDALDNKKLGAADATALRSAINALIATL